LRPQVLLVDISIRPDRLAGLLTQIQSKGVKTLLIDPELNSGQIVEALRWGANGIIGRETTPELLCRSVRAVASGDIWVGREVTTELVGFLRKRQVPMERPVSGLVESARSAAQVTDGSPENPFGMTTRELQIVRVLGEAQSNKDIAEILGISEFTVKHHLTNIFDKLGVYNRVELALFATHHQLCPPSRIRDAITIVPRVRSAIAGGGGAIDRVEESY
jgi:DNA-binding NarL/FixJ family response regulator